MTSRKVSIIIESKLTVGEIRLALDPLSEDLSDRLKRARGRSDEDDGE